MHTSRNSRRQLQVQNLIFMIGLLTFVGILGWMSTLYSFQSDWTSSNRNTISDSSKQLLDSMTSALKITAFSREASATRVQIRDLVSRYQRHKKDISLNFINPDVDPERIRKLGIALDGELLIDYQGRSEKVREITEQALSNALLRVARSQQQSILFLSGHGEANPLGQTNHDWGSFGNLLQRKGIQLDLINLGNSAAIPQDTRLLVIAAPQVSLLDGEVRLINQYIRNGGNLLWLVEPTGIKNLQPLADLLSIEFLPGTIVDATTQLFGIDDPAFALISEYSAHPITRDMISLSLFPQATALEITSLDHWTAQPILTTLDRAWTELNLDGENIQYDPKSDERAGPLNIAFALTKPNVDNREQRIVVVGDSNFLSNAYLGNGANAELGLNIFNWLSHDDQLISITATTASDIKLELSKLAQMFIGFGFLFVLPLLLIASGTFIWWRRRQR